MAECNTYHSPKEGTMRRGKISNAGRGLRPSSARRGLQGGPGARSENHVSFKDLKLGTRAVKLVSARPETTVCGIVTH